MARFAVMRGQTFKLVVCTSDEMSDKDPDTYGECDPPGRPERSIRFLNRITGPELLETFVHELLHAGCFDLSEDCVTEIAHDLARELIARGCTLNIEDI